MNKKRLALLVTFCLLLISTHAISEKIDITITRDKSMYVSGETAALTIDITNRGDTTVRNLQIQNFIPTGLTYADESTAEKTIKEIQPGASAKHTILVKKIPIDIPVTGDPSHPLVWAVLILTGSVYLFRRFRRNENKTEG